jgi:hypothetical protein
MDWRAAWYRVRDDLSRRTGKPNPTVEAAYAEMFRQGWQARDAEVEWLQAALTSVISRYETARELDTQITTHIPRAMAFDVVRGMARAFPEDRFYQRRLSAWEAEESSHNIRG